MDRLGVPEINALNLAFKFHFLLPLLVQKISKYNKGSSLGLNNAAGSRGASGVH